MIKQITIIVVILFLGVLCRLYQLFTDEGAFSRLVFDVLKPWPPPSSSPVEDILVVGCALCRTGTSSLRLALQELGYKVYHGIDIERFDHRQVWIDSLNSKDVDKAIDAILHAGFNATLDLPQALVCLEIFKRFPSSKVVLTVRDSPEQWARSFRTVTDLVAPFLVDEFPYFYLQPGRGSFYRALLSFVGEKYNWNYSLKRAESILPWVNYVDRLEFSDGDVERIYSQYVQEVKDTVPDDQLLVYNVKDGWGPLVEFLEVEQPQNVLEFPFDNEGAVMKMVARWFRGAVLWTPIVCGALIAIMCGCTMSCCRRSSKKRKVD